VLIHPYYFNTICRSAAFSIHPFLAAADKVENDNLGFLIPLTAGGLFGLPQHLCRRNKTVGIRLWREL